MEKGLRDADDGALPREAGVALLGHGRTVALYLFLSGCSSPTCTQLTYHAD
jgi:hypothetical protein